MTLEHAYGDASDVPEMLRTLENDGPDGGEEAFGGAAGCAVRAAAPSITRTLAWGMLGDDTIGPGGGWAGAVAGLCAGHVEWACDEVLA